MKPLHQTNERRVYERLDYTGHIVVGRPTKGITLVGTILNLSIGGCLIKLRTPTDLKPDAVIEIGVHCGSLAFCSLGHVKRHQGDACLIGIEFLNLGLEGRRALRALISGFKKTQEAVPAIAAQTAGPTPHQDTGEELAAAAAWSMQCHCVPS